MMPNADLIDKAIETVATEIINAKVKNPELIKALAELIYSRQRIETQSFNRQRL